MLSSSSSSSSSDHHHHSSKHHCYIYCANANGNANNNNHQQKKKEEEKHNTNNTMSPSPVRLLDHNNNNNNNHSPSSIQLMKEIATVELQILRLESYLLSLYRTAFQHHLPPSHTNQSYYNKFETDLLKKCDAHQVSHSYAFADSNHQIQSASNSPSTRQLQESKSIGSGHRSLADHLGTSVMDNDALNCADKLSEQIIRCISSIYYRLSNPTPAAHQGSSASSTSSTSSSSTFSPKNLSASWSSQGTRDSDFEGLKDERGPYALMTQVLKLCLDDDSFKYAAITLQKFRSLVKGLENIDPLKMKREEKLAFWINIHNALVMHAYLAYGTHNYTRNSSILKAAYNVGGHCINAYDIQYSILGIRTHYSAPWLQTLLSPGKKFMAGAAKHVYAIEYPEPLVHFALCSGAYSDPAVRVYKAKNVFQDLKVAKEEFIQSSIYIHKETKLYLPKILSYFAKDMSLNMAGLLEIVIECLPELRQKAIRTCLKGRPEKYVYWLPQNSTFRYLIHKEVVQGGGVYH